CSAILNGSEAWTDYSLKVLARVVGEEAAGESSYKVFARTTGGASSFDGYAFEIDTNYSNRFAIKRIVDGMESATLITSVTSAGFDWNQWQEISVTVIGNEFSMHINGIEVLRYTDTEGPYLSGNAGLGCEGAIQVEFDYVRVYNASVDLREWIPYTYSGDPVYDESGNADGSHGGSVNPSEVDIVSTPSLPSVMVYFDSGVMMFRVVLGGTPLVLTGSGTPYKSSTWVVLIDIDGDGYRDFAVELDGTDSGKAPDDIKVFYGTIKNQYLYDSDLIWKQDSAKHIYNPTDSDGEPEGPANWDRDPSPSVWDFSRTRVTQHIDPVAGTVYILDIQVPLSALDATSVGAQSSHQIRCFSLLSLQAPI
ncbi:MAG: family 16 glycoside hydrolase, partial [Kosmotogaceae bacterium]